MTVLHLVVVSCAVSIMGAAYLVCQFLIKQNEDKGLRARLRNLRKPNSEKEGLDIFKDNQYKTVWQIIMEKCKGF